MKKKTEKRNETKRGQEDRKAYKRKRNRRKEDKMCAVTEQKYEIKTGEEKQRDVYTQYID